MDSNARWRRGLLGAAIQQAREDARPPRTQQQVAASLGCGQSKIQKIESGQSLVKPDDLRRILEFLEVGPNRREEIARLAHECGLDAERRQQGARDTSPEWFRPFRDYEELATDISSWQPHCIPGLLQAEPYMLRQFYVGRRIRDINDAVLARVKRKAVFGKPTLASYRAVIDQQALEYMPGGSNPMIALEQVQYMLKLIHDHPKVSIQILPSGGKVAWRPPGFTIMWLHGETNPRAFVEHSAGITPFRRREELKKFTDDWHALLSAALPYHESWEFLQCKVEELRREATS